MRPVQYFTDEYLAESRKLTPTEIARFLEDFQRMHLPKQKMTLISVKVPENLLKIFRKRCQLEKIPYQTQLKKLMREWVEK